LGWGTRKNPKFIKPVEIPVYAYKGERVTCENGHVVCEFVETVFRGGSQALDVQLGYWRQKKPVIGQMELPRCEICGAKWYYGGIFHTMAGWRDPYGLIEKYGMLLDDESERSTEKTEDSREKQDRISQV
jgi:hypothetical protein